MKEKCKFVHNRSYKYYFDTAKIKKIGNKIDILLTSQTKLNNTSPLSQFVLQGFAPPCRLDRTSPLSQFILQGFDPPYRLDRTEHGGGLMLLVRENISSKLLPKIENIFVKTNLR